MDNGREIEIDAADRAWISKHLTDCLKEAQSTLQAKWGFASPVTIDAPHVFYRITHGHVFSSHCGRFEIGADLHWKTDAAQHSTAFTLLGDTLGLALRELRSEKIVELVLRETVASVATDEADEDERTLRELEEKVAAKKAKAVA